MPAWAGVSAAVRAAELRQQASQRGSRRGANARRQDGAVYGAASSREDIYAQTGWYQLRYYGVSRTNEFAETPPGSGPSAGVKDRATKANTVFLSVLESVTTLPAAHIPTAICVRAARGAARARHQFSFSLPLRNSYLRTALACGCLQQRAPKEREH